MRLYNVNLFSLRLLSGYLESFLNNMKDVKKYSKSVLFFNYLLKLSLVIYLISFSIPLFSNIPLILLSLTGVISIRFLNVNNRRVFFAHSTVFLLLFMSSFLLSALFSCNRLKTLSLLPSILPGIIIFFLITEFCKKRDYHLIYFSCCFSSALISLITITTAVLSETASPSIWIRQARLPYFIVPNDLMLLSVFIPYMIIEGIQHRKTCIKLFSSVVILLNLAMFTIYHSRGGIFISLIAVFISLLSSKKQIKNTFLLLLLILIAIFIFDFSVDFGLTKKILADSNSWLTRLEPWSVAWEIFKMHPIFGSGPRTFGVFHPQMPWAHNLYLEILAEQGLPGIISFLALVLSLLRTSGKKFFNENVSATLFCSSFVLFIGGIIEYSFVRHLFVVIFFIINSLVSVCLNYSEKMEE